CMADNGNNYTKKDKKPKTKAAALSYDINKDKAPILLASGQGVIAERIIEEARKQDIPIEENQDIIDILVQLNIGEEIPAELYQAVAEILSFIYRLEEESS
ncbi:MAG: EscU/YscU/HrcU family type III secretion system export apparatus switch protein, partial [Halanaerobiales bacterium]